MQQEQLTEKKRKKLKLHKRFSDGTGWFIKKSLVMAVKVKGGAEKKPKQGGSNVFVPKFCDAGQFKSSSKKLEVVCDGSRDKYKEFMDTEFIKVSVGIFSGKAEKVAKALAALLNFFEQKKNKNFLIKCCATEKNFNFFKKSPGFESVNLQFRNLDSQGHDVPVSVCIAGVTISAVIESQFLKGSSQVVTGAVIIPEIAQYLAENKGRGQFRDQYAIYEELRRRTPLLYIFSSAGAVGTGGATGSGGFDGDDGSDGVSGSGGSDGASVVPGSEAGGGSSDDGSGGAAGSGGSPDGGSEAAGSDVASEAAGGGGGGGGSVVLGSEANVSSGYNGGSEASGSSGVNSGSEASASSGSDGEGGEIVSDGGGSGGGDVAAGSGGGGSEAGGGSDDKSVVSVSETSVIIESDRESFSDDGGGSDDESVVSVSEASVISESVSGGDGGGGVAAGAGGGGGATGSDGGGGSDVVGGGGGGSDVVGGGGGGADGGGGPDVGSEAESEAKKETAAVDELEKKINDLSNYLFMLETQIIPKSTLEVLNIIDANILKKIKKIDVMYDKITKTEEIKKKKNYLDAKYREFKNALEDQKFKIITLEIFTIKVKQQAKRKKKKKQEAEAAELAATQGQEETAAAEELNTPTELQQEADEAVQLATVETTETETAAAALAERQQEAAKKKRKQHAEAVSKRKRKRDEANSERKRKRSKSPVLDRTAAAETALAAEQPQKAAAPQQQKEAELNTILSYTEQTAAKSNKQIELQKEAAELERQQKAAEDAEVERLQKIKDDAIKKIIKKIKDAKQNMEKNNYSEIFKNLFFLEIKRANNILIKYNVEQLNVEEISNSVKIDEEKLAKIKEKEEAAAAAINQQQQKEEEELEQQEAEKAAEAELQLKIAADKAAAEQRQEEATAKAIAEQQKEAEATAKIERQAADAAALQKQKKAEAAASVIQKKIRKYQNEKARKKAEEEAAARLKEAKDAAALMEQQKEIADAETRVNDAYNIMEKNNYRKEDTTKFFEEINIFKEKINANEIFLKIYKKEINILEKLQIFVQKKVEEIRATEAAEVERLRIIKEAAEAAEAEEAAKEEEEIRALFDALQKADGEVDDAYNNAINNVTEENIKNFYAKIQKVKKIDKFDIYINNYTDKKNLLNKKITEEITKAIDEFTVLNDENYSRIQAKIKNLTEFNDNEQKKVFNDLLDEQNTKLQVEQLKKEISELTYDVVINDEKLQFLFSENITKFNITDIESNELALLLNAKFEEMHLIKLSIDEADAEVTAAYNEAINNNNITKENIENFYAKIDAVNKIFTVNEISKSIDYTEKIKKLKKKIKKEITNEINKFVVLNDENYEIIKAKIQNLTEFFNENEKAELYNLLEEQNTKLQVEEITKAISELTYDDVIIKKILLQLLLSKIGELITNEKDKKLLKVLLFEKSAEKNLIKTSIDSADAKVNAAYEIAMTNVTEENIKNFYAKIDAVNKIFSDNQISKSIDYDYTEKINELKEKITKEITEKIQEFTVLTDYKTIQAKIKNLTEFNDNEQKKVFNDLLDEQYTKLQVEQLKKEISELTYDVVINNIYSNNNYLQDDFYGKISTFEISDGEKTNLNQLLTVKFEDMHLIKQDIDNADAKVTRAYDEAMANATEKNIEFLYQKISEAYKIFEENGKPGYKDYSKKIEEVQQRQVDELIKEEAKLKKAKKAEKIKKISKQKEIIDNKTFAKINTIFDGKEINKYTDGLTNKSKKLVEDAEDMKELNKSTKGFIKVERRKEKELENAKQTLYIAYWQALRNLYEIIQMVIKIRLLIYKNYLKKSKIEKKNNINIEDILDPEKIKNFLESKKKFKNTYDTAIKLEDEAIAAEEEINKIYIKSKKIEENENKDKPEKKKKLKIERKNIERLRRETERREKDKIMENNFNEKVEFERKKKEIAELKMMQSQQRAINSAKQMEKEIDEEISKEKRNPRVLYYQFDNLSNLYNKNKNIQAIADIFEKESKIIAEIKEENRRKTEERNKIIKNEKKMLKKLKEKERKKKNFEEKKETERKLQVTEINLSKITNEKKNQTYCMAALASASYPLLLFAAIGATDSLSAIPEFFSGEVGAVFLNCAALFTTYNSLMGYIRNWYIDINKEKITKILEKLIGKTEIEKEDIYNTLNANDKKLIDDLEKNMHQAIEENAATAELET